MKILGKFATHRKFAAYLSVALGCSIGAAAQQDVISTIAGRGPNAIPGAIANLYNPYTLATDAAGNIYFSAQSQNKVFKLAPSGTLTILAGTGFSGYNGDGILATTAQVNQPTGITVDNANPANVYFTEFQNCLVRKVDQATGIISTVAGVIIKPTTGSPYPQCGYNGLGSSANKTNLNGPQDVAWDPSTGNLYVSDYNSGRLLQVAGASATGAITQVAGAGGSTTSSENCQGSAPYGQGGLASDAYLCNPQAVTIDTSVKPSNIFLTENSHCDVLEIVGATKKIYQVAGNSSYNCGFTDGVKATESQLNDPWQVVVSVKGSTSTITVADYYNGRIRQFPLTYSSNVPQPGTINTIAGKGGGYCGDGGGALDACMDPVGLYADSAGDLYVSDYGNDRVREISAKSGDINTVVGWGPNGGTTNAYSDPIGIPSGAIGNDLALYLPNGLYVDPSSTNLYISGYESNAVYRMNTSSDVIADVVGNGAAGFLGDGTAANGSGVELNQPVATVLDQSGNLYIADQANCVVREVEASSGVITTIAGGSSGVQNGCGFSGNGGLATKAQLSYPNALAVDGSNNLYVGEYYNCDVRKIALGSGVITTVAGDPILGCGFSGDGGAATAAQIYNVTGIALDGAGNLYVSSSNGQRVRKVTAATGIITTFAGTGQYGYTGDGLATSVGLGNPNQVSSDVNGNVFIADSGTDLIRWVEPGGQLITIAGTPNNPGYGGDGGVATSALLYQPYAVARDSSGNTYISDSYTGLIRKVSAFAGFGRSVNSLSFETQPAGTTSDFQPIILSAVGPITFYGITASSGFSEIDDCVGVELTAGQTCEVDVYFEPGSAGTYHGTLSISSNAFFAANSDTITLSGTGGGLTVTGSLAFGTQTINTTTSRTVTLTNTGALVKIDSIALDRPASFSISASTCPASGGTLANGASCAITVAFDPTTIDGKTDTLVITSSDPASPLLVGANGNGTEVVLSTTSAAFGSIPNRNTATYNVTVTNKGTVALTISTAISGAQAGEFAVATTSANTCKSGVAAGTNCTLPVIFNPTTVGAAAASLTLTTNGGSNPVIALSGTSTTDAALSATSINFATLVYGATETTDLTITNLSAESLTVSPAFSGTGSGAYKIGSGNTCGSAIAAGGKCTLPVEFDPTSAATFDATLTLTTNGGSNPTVALTGTATAAIKVSASSIAFAKITHGTSETTNLTITNVGSAKLTFTTAFSGTGAADFSINATGDTCGSGIAAGGTCTLPVKFTPAAAASYSATLTLTSTGGANPTVALSGTGD